jgi:hypothetical protein
LDNTAVDLDDLDLGSCRLGATARGVTAGIRTVTGPTLARLLAPAVTIWEMSRAAQTRRHRLQALVLAAVAIGLVVVEPFPKGVVLLSLTHTHGIDVGDLPALALLLVAACLAV